MPIHDQGYRRYGGTRVAPGRAWSVILRAGLRTMLQRKAFVALLLLSWGPFLVRAVQMYMAATFTQAAFLAPDAQLFRDFLDQQSVFLFFITVFVGSGLIANDRRANALQIYLSKPMTRVEYVFGKFTVLATLLLFVTWVPATLLLLVQIAFSGSVTFFVNNLFLFPAITLFSSVQVGAVSIMMLALSSLSRSARYVGILHAVLIFFSRAVYGIVYAVTGDSRLAFISIPHDLEQVGDFVFRLPLRNDLPVVVAVLTLMVWMVASGYVLRQRVRGLEVVT